MDVIEPDEIQKEIGEEGYTVNKDIIMEAWARFRPVQLPGRGKKKAVKTIGELKKVFPKEFIHRLISNTHLKIYSYNETDRQITRKKDFKGYITIYKRKMAAD